MIPVEHIDPRAPVALYEYLQDGIRRARSERRPLEERWIEFHRLYRAQPEFKVKEFPFLGASNLVIPLVATDVETIYSRIMGLLFGPENLWSTRPLRPDTTEFARKLQEFLRVVQDRELGAYEAVADWVMEICKLGTGVLKQRYRREQKLAYQFRETGAGLREQIQTLMTHDHPVIQHVSLFDFLIPPGVKKLENAPWAAERILLDWPTFVSRVRHGIYIGDDRLRTWFTQKGGRVLEALMQMDSYEPGLGDKIELWECWCEYDLGQGVPQAVVATIHIPSNTIVRLDYNPFLNQEKPYSIARYMRQEGRFYGIGLAEMNEHFQLEVTAMHNQRIDAGTIANSSMMKARKGVVSEDEPIFPGRWFTLDNMEDIQPLQFGDAKFSSSANDEQMSVGYAKLRSGVNDYMLGNTPPSVGYAAAVTNVQQFEQTVKRFDMTLREIRKALGESAARVVEMYQQFNQGGKPFMYLGEEDGQIVQEFLDFPTELARMAVGVEVTATTAAESKDMEIRTNTLIMQQLNEYYSNTFQAMQIVFNPQIPEPMRMAAAQMIQGSNVLMRQILESHGVQDVDQLIPRLAEANNGRGPIQAPGQGVIPGGQGALPGMAQAAGNGGLPPGGGGSPVGGAPVPPQVNGGRGVI